MWTTLHCEIERLIHKKQFLVQRLSARMASLRWNDLQVWNILYTRQKRRHVTLIGYQLCRHAMSTDHQNQMTPRGVSSSPTNLSRCSLEM